MIIKEKENKEMLEVIEQMELTEEVKEYILKTEEGRRKYKAQGKMGYIILKTVDGKEYVVKIYDKHIIRDKKDKGYRNAMLIGGLESWYIDTIRRLKIDDENAEVEYLPFREVLYYLSFIKDCQMVQYTYEKGGKIESVLVNIEEYKELNYREVTKCIEIATGGEQEELIAIEYRKVRN